MRMYKWLWISALMFLGASAALFYDYRNSMDGPSSFWGDASLVGIAGHPVHAECTRFSTPGGKGTIRKIFADPHVKFSYVYEGVAYQGLRYSRTRKYDLLTPDECDMVIQAFLNSQSVTIWVDPKNPSYSVLKTELPFPLIELSLMLIGGLVLAFAGYLQFAESRAQ